MYSIKEEFNGGMTTLEDKEYEGDETPKIRESTGRWTTVEHQLFLRGLELYGKGWKKIACLIKTRAVVQIRTHAQKYFLKLTKARQSGGNTGGESLVRFYATFSLQFMLLNFQHHFNTHYRVD